MALKHNLLAMLCRKPQSGYDLYKSIFEPMRPERSIIYRQLNDMAKSGLVSFVRREQAKYPARKVFSITEAGLDELNSWYQEPDHLFLHDPLQAQIWFGSCVDKKTLTNLIRKYVEYIKKNQKYYRDHTADFINKMLAKEANRLDYFYWWMVLERGDEVFASYVRWAEEAIKRIEEFDGSDDQAEIIVKNWMRKIGHEKKSRKKK